jgi:hypothetical protein
MTHHPTAVSRRRAFGGAFHEYVRGVFADQSDRARALRVSRARWLRHLARASSGALQRWEGEGGNL